MFLSDKDIKKAIKDKELKIEGDELYIGPASVDLHLAGTAKVFENCEYIDSADKDSIKYDEFKFEKLIIYPRKFYILSTKEIVKLSANVTGFVHGRSSLARIGLNIHMAGFVDPGFEGTITMEVTNFTRYPIYIYKDMRICQIVFAKTISPSMIPYNKKKDSKYQGQIDPTLSKIYEDFKK